MTQFFNNELLEPDRLPVAMAAWLLAGIIGMITGPMHGNANPFVWMLYDKTFGKLGGRLDKRERDASDLLFRGFILTVLAIILAYGIGLFAVNLTMRHPLWGASEIILLSLTLTSGAVWFALLKLYFAMRDKKVGQGAYYAIAHSTRTDFSGSDDFAITRAGMGFVARSFDKGLVAPVFWYLLAGLPGAFIYAGTAALAWRFGRDGFTRGFGKTALALEKLLGFAPHLLAGALMALAGLFTPTGGMTRAFLGQLFGKERAAYDEGGLPVTAMAFSLNVSLGGPSIDLEGSAVKRKWTGPENATAQLEKGHLRRAIYIGLMAHLLLMVSLVGTLAWAGKIF